jgi:hypothetical protein
MTDDLNAMTLKALANSSPGLRFGNLQNTRLSFIDIRNPERVASPSTESQPRRNSFRVAKNLLGIRDPGFQSKPWAGISERFQRYS